MVVPSDQFLRLLWRPLYACFFAFYIGALDQFLCVLYWGPQFTFFAYYMGAPRISFFSHNMGAPLRSLLLTSLLRANERKYHENKLEINKDDSTKCWKTIKEVIGNNAGLKDQSSTIIINGKEIKDRQIICNEFNNYCVNIGPKLARNFENSLNPMQYVKSILNSISIPIISESEIVAAIKSLKNGSAGYDAVPAHILKQNINIFIKPLTHLINSSIKRAFFLMNLK